MPQNGRQEWLGRWHSNLAAWQVLRDRGELTRPQFGGIVHFYRSGVSNAVALRLRTDAAQASLHGPGIVLSGGAALLVLLALATHGFRGTQSLFWSVPIQDPSALVSVQYPARPSERAATLARLIPAWREKSTLARDIAGYRYAYNASGARVTWNFFSLLGTRPAAGRLFQPGDRDAVVLSYPAWRSIYRSNPRIIGSTIHVDGRAYKVVGILPELFWALSPAIDVWAPLDLATTPPPGSRLILGTVARPRPGVTIVRLGRELTELARTANPGPLRAVRIESFSNRLPGLGIFWYLVGTLFSLISALVMVAKEHRRPTGHGWRYWPFLALKTMLAIAIPLLIWMELGALLRTYRPALGFGDALAQIAAALVFIVTCVRGLWWSFADQRRRCPACLRRLAMPVTLGSPASVFDPALTELVCPNGHGSLSLPEDETDRPDRWVALDSSWDELFKNKSAQ